MLKKTLFILALLLPAPHSPAQTRGQAPFPPIPGIDSRRRGRPLGTPEEEILKRAEIKREEESHSEMVERADEAERLGLDLRAAFDKQKRLSPEDLKRLERIEKLARKIRGSAGGSDDDEQLDDPPARVEEAVARLAEVSVKLNESVRKTTRHVVSGTVIRRSNELLELVRHVRGFIRP